jgi:hypothetical protein
MSRNAYRYLILAVLLPWLGACSMGQIVARSSVSIMDGSVEAMNRETDLVLAEAAIPANLKLIEGLIREDPRNVELLANAAQGFYGYARHSTAADSISANVLCRCWVSTSNWRKPTRSK